MRKKQHQQKKSVPLAKMYIFIHMEAWRMYCIIIIIFGRWHNNQAVFCLNFQEADKWLNNTAHKHTQTPWKWLLFLFNGLVFWTPTEFSGVITHSTVFVTITELFFYIYFFQKSLKRLKKRWYCGATVYLFGSNSVKFGKSGRAEKEYLNVINEVPWQELKI